MNNAPHAARHERLIIVLVTILAGIGPFCSDSYLPSLPTMTQFFHTNISTMQLTITVFMLGISLSQLIYGPLSDRLGRRKVILIGFSICILGSILCSIATSATTLIIARLLQGVGTGVTNALYRAIMRDTFTGTRMSKVASLVGIVFALMPALAPIIGGYIETSLGWRANFIFLALLVMSTWLIIWQWLPETNKNLDPTATQIKIVLKNYLMLLTHRSFISHVALASLGMAGLVTYITISPFLFQNILGLSPIEYGWLAIYITIGIMIGQYLNSLLVTKFGIKNMLLIGILAMLFSGIALLITGVINFLNTTAIMIPVLIFTAGLCFVFSNAMTSAFHPFPHMAGSAGAMYGCLQTFGGFLTSLIVAGIHETNQLPLATIYIFLGTASALIYYFFIRKEQL